MPAPGTKLSGFTLIELLIVVAIIAILAAIAVPNFIEAQTRSKVAKVKADFRALATGLEAYVVDEKKYPASYAVGHVIGTEQIELCLWRLTTPIPYMTSVALRDPFGSMVLVRGPKNSRPVYMYFNYEPVNSVSTNDWMALISTPGQSNYRAEAKPHRAFVLWSAGPNRNDETLYWVDYAGSDTRWVDYIYDPTNGTVSFGDIARLGGSYVSGWFKN